MHKSRQWPIIVGVTSVFFYLLFVASVDNAVGSGSKGGGGGGKRGTISKKMPDRKQDSSTLKIGHVATLYVRPKGLGKTGRVYKNVTIRRFTKSYVVVEKNGKTFRIPRRSLDTQTQKRFPSSAEIKKQEQARRDYGERIRTDPEYHYKHAIRGKYQYKNGRLVRLEKGQSKADGLTYKQYLVLRKRGVDMPASVPP